MNGNGQHLTPAINGGLQKVPQHQLQQQSSMPQHPTAFSKEIVQEMYQKYKAMQAQGFTDSQNPEMGNLGNILRAIQAQQRQRKASQDPSQIQTNGQGIPSTGKTYAPAEKSEFSDDQKALLRNQIAAFKFLQKNLPIPSSIQAALFQKAIVQPSTDDAPERIEYTTSLDPRKYMPTTISYEDHADRANRPIIPSIMPSGIDLEEISAARETAITNRIKHRLNELEQMPSNIEGFTMLLPRKDFSGEEDEDVEVKPSGKDLKIKLLIEYKSLRLLEKQKAIREKMLHPLPLFSTLIASADRAQFRRMKTQSLRESRLTETLERQQRTDRERREKQKQLDYLAGITSHASTLAANAQQARAKAQKLGRGVLSYHAYIEKEEQRRLERNAKQRLQALKADDEEAYLKLIDQAKDTRITHLLRQTNSYLDSLALAVKAQQGSSNPVPKEDEDEEGKDNEDKTDYYHIAHKIQETVSEQPRILVGGQLKEYQIKGLQWMISLYNNRLNGILADEMGLGKTIQTISLIAFLIEKKRQNGPFLVIVPLSTLTNWTLEFEKWAPTVNKIVYKGTPPVRKSLASQVRQGAFQVLLTTYEYIIKDRPVLAKIKWVHMIIDEGHRMKNANSKLTSTLVQYYSTRYRLILTGTPLQNNLPELWALLNFVLPRIFNSVKSFDEWFNTPFANTGGQDKMELSEEESLLVIRRLHKVLRPFLLRRLKKDVEKDLPDKVENVIKCQLSALQKKLYDQMKKHGMLFVNSDGGKGRTGIKGLNNTLMQLKKICNHPFVFEEVERAISPEKGNDDQLWRSAGKFELLDRILPKFKRTGHRCLMFFQMTQIMNIMEDFLHYRGFKYLRLDGSTKADDRSILLRDFNAPGSEYFIFLLSTRAGGLGLNLQSADTVIIYDSDWNPHQDLQAQDRAHRIGQTKEVRVLRLVTEKSIEESILARAQYKLDIDGKVIQAGKFDNKSTAEEREAFLRSLLENDPGLTEEDDKEEPESVEDDYLNEIIARSEEEKELFAQMDRDREAMSQYGPGKDKTRLMCDEELPEAYHLENDVAVEEYFSTVGRGARERNQIKYDDGLTEEQWLNAIDDDEVDLDDVINKARDKDSKKLGKRGMRIGQDSTGASSPASTVDGMGRKGKRTRHSRAQSIDPDMGDRRKRVRTADNSPKPKKIAKTGGDPLPPAARAAYTKIFDTCLAAMQEATDLETGRGRTDIFLQLPPRKIYPDYYAIIRRPIAIDKIKKKINSNTYTSVHDFRGDFELMFANARTYNEEGSFVWDDANALHQILLATLERLAPGGNADIAKIEAAATPPHQDDEDDDDGPEDFAEEDDGDEDDDDMDG